MGSGQARMAPSDVITPALARLGATTDPTATGRVLASAGLPKENAFYQAHLRSAGTLTTVLGTRNSPILDQLASSAADADAAAITAGLRDAARHDEQEAALAEPLPRAHDAAVAL